MAETPAPKRAAPTRNEDSAPAEMAGFLTEVPDPLGMETTYAGEIELGRMAAASPSLPSRGPVTISSGLHRMTAGQVAYAPPIEARDYATPMSEHPPEAREFGRLVPVIEIRPRTDDERVPEAVLESMEIELASFPPQSAGIPWLGLSREFPPVVVELGALARLDFAPSGAPAREVVPATQGEPEAGDAAPQLADTMEAQEPLAEEVPLPEPEFANPVHVESVAVEPEPVESEAQVEELIPDMVTQPLPVTLHGTVPGRGRIAPAFASALCSDVDLQIPPAIALPLRPTMVLGPAPVAAPKPEPKRELKIEVKPEAKRELKIELKSEPKSEPKPELKTEIKPEFKTEPRTEPKKEIQKRTEKPARPPITIKRKVEAPARTVEPPAPAPVPVAEVPRFGELPTWGAQNDQPSSSPSGSPSGSSNTFDLGLPSLDVQAGPWARLSTTVKIGLAAVIVAAVGGLGYLVTSGGHSTTSPAKAVRQEMTVAPGLPIPDAGWIADWSPDSANPSLGRRISMLKGSLPLTDCRVEFQAQIESKALGWVFRGKDPKNFYVTKLEVIKPGLEPTVALVHFAVINGHEQDRAQVPLPLPVRVDTTYKIRFEAVGNRFTTWVQDQKIDEWNDSRIASGGAGLYSERGESSTLQGVFNVSQLVVKN